VSAKLGRRVPASLTSVANFRPRVVELTRVSSTDASRYLMLGRTAEYR